MAIQYQYNKTSLQNLEKQLKIRERALPTIKNKESALRLEVKKAKAETRELEKKLEMLIENYREMHALWTEFNAELIKVKDVELGVRKVAGVRIPVLEEVLFEIAPYSMFHAPKWYAGGLDLLKKLATAGIEQDFSVRKLQLLEYARKKTTQKVNLFEKVQIPGYQDAILKIKRYMEDEENLSKSSQKIVKTRQNAQKQEESL
ncbi:MAG: V-type ATP synthase subunit D [Bacteroidales bacterium]|jgi:V/A-type H+-transporting ATPase subunit D|nr:V-type ATP synthase subunit D [Bacteroidales bacterium]MDI9544836.1 V-type ATP synthase subunit D [Bacteroidota bacterium]OQC03922.1 MAG: V-type ATP synthase subunit D [Bacteroidetes bacterium ADurb.Bin090]NLV38409.1 V-type ATP synthase subunit D [Bacteroidales bacterium]HNZ80720.1 V-type ATP synthase subunit D [Bacteroidales bacterium]